jgi:hypothetical protein
MRPWTVQYAVILSPLRSKCHAIPPKAGIQLMVEACPRLPGVFHFRGGDMGACLQYNPSAI